MRTLFRGLLVCCMVIGGLLFQAPVHAQSQKLEIIPPPVLAATVGQPFSATFTATLPVKWRQLTLPSWLKVQSQDPNTITFAGTPPTKGSFNGAVNAKALERDVSGKKSKAHADFTVIVTEPLPVPDFTLKVNPILNTIFVGGLGATYTVTLVPEAGFNELVSLAIVQPPGLMVNLLQSTLTIDTASSIVVNAPQGFAPGRYTVTLSGSTRSGLMHTTSFDVIVEAKPKTVPLSIQEEALPNIYVGATQTATIHIVGGSVSNKISIVPATTTADFAELTTVTYNTAVVTFTKPTTPGPYALTLAVVDEANPTNHTEKTLKFQVLGVGENNGVWVEVNGTSFANGSVMQIHVHYDAGKKYPYKAIVTLENANGDGNRYSEMARIVNGASVISGTDTTLSWTVAYPTDKCQGSCNAQRFRVRVVILDTEYQQQHQFEFPAGTSADVMLQ